MNGAGPNPPPVVRSIEDRFGERCVDLIRQGDHRFTFKEYRRDVEDGGRWTLTQDFSATTFASESLATEAAVGQVGWLADAMA